MALFREPKKVGFQKKHGDGGSSDGTGRTKLYMVWSGMRARCRDSRHISYGHYGARGVSVCAEWNDFAVFKKWALENGYAEGLEIDRERTDGDYEPSNCRWITTQQNRRRQKPTYIIFGEAKTMMEWSEDARCVCSYYTLRNRIQRGWGLEESVTTPTQSSTGAKLHGRSYNSQGGVVEGRTPLKPRIKSLRRRLS